MSSQLDVEGGARMPEADKPDKPLNLTYELPKLVESVRQGWIISAQGAAVVSVLLCGAETQLISMVQSGKTTPVPAYRFLLLLSYSAFMLNASATIASLLMIDRLGEIPIRAARLLDNRSTKGVYLSDDSLLEDHCAGGRWTWMKWHCLLALIAGSWCMVLQIWLYVYLNEARSVWITMSVVCAIGIVPWFALCMSD